jgi:DNA-binding Lrp family transcriptional regulator
MSIEDWRNSLRELGVSPTYRTVRVLAAISALGAWVSKPGAGPSNREVAEAAGIVDEAQASRLLKRLEGVGLIENVGARNGAMNAWRLTALGLQLENGIRDEATAAARVVLDLPEAFRGRLDHQAIAVLRAIGDEPWLANRELAVRAGIEDLGELSRLLAQLVKLRLVANARAARRRGAANAWRLTARGEELDRAIGRETPAPPRSRVLDLMWESGRPLDERAISVLSISAAEPGLSNREIAVRVGIGNQMSMSNILKLLDRRGLIENRRNGGRTNVWRPTANGEQLVRAIRAEREG